MILYAPVLLVDRGGLTPLGSHADARSGGGGSEPAEQPDERGGSFHGGAQRGCLPWRRLPAFAVTVHVHKLVDVR